MTLTEYDEQEQMKLFREEGREEGMRLGVQRGIERGEAKQIIESVISLRKKLNISDEEACNLLDVSIEQYQAALILMEEK